jgi:hypothetical protein
MRVIIAGTRLFDDYELLKAKCLEIIPNVAIGDSTIEIISGHADGADKLGEKFALSKRLTLKQFIPNWKRDGKAAGMLRNTRMAKYAKESENGSMLIAFWDGKSRGTKQMIDTATKTGIDKIEVILYNEHKKEIKDECTTKTL